MTPTERAAVAEAIAALEKALVPESDMREKDLAWWARKCGQTWNKLCKAEEKIAVLEDKLRAVAPASAEDKTLLEEAWGALNFILAFYEPGQRYLDTNAWKQAEASGRAVHAKLRAAIDDTTAPADQSDAGRDAVIGSVWRHLKTGHVVTIVGRCRLEATNEPAYLYDHDGVIWARSTDQFLDGRFEHHFDRALANAPSETVGRGDEGKESFLSKWTKVINATPLNLKRGEPLPTADRDAIREALKEAITFMTGEIDYRLTLYLPSSDPDDADEDWKKFGKPMEILRIKLTAALALIGEG